MFEILMQTKSLPAVLAVFPEFAVNNSERELLTRQLSLWQPSYSNTRNIIQNLQKQDTFSGK